MQMPEKSARASSTAEMGLSMKIMKLPSDSTMDWSKARSQMGPSTKPMMKAPAL